MNSFRNYVLHPKVIACVPNSVVKDILVQATIEGKRGKWIAKIHEYDMEIKPTKLVKGQGLEKLLTYANCVAMGVSLVAPIFYQPKESTTPLEVLSKVCPNFFASPWYKDVIFFLQYLKCPDHLERYQACSLKLKAIKYCILHGKLYWKDPRGISLTCVTKEQTTEIINEFHKDICSGHQAWRTMEYKIL